MKHKSLRTGLLSILKTATTPTCSCKYIMQYSAFIIKEMVSGSDNIFLWNESKILTKKVISKISVDSNFAFTKHAWSIMCIGIAP